VGAKEPSKKGIYSGFRANIRNYHQILAWMLNSGNLAEAKHAEHG
jgi:hypothetical protein